MTKRSEKKLNLAEIGRRFQVSAATVSNVLNNKGKVSSELADRIVAYADEIGYRPSLLAQSLKGHSKIIGLCLRGSLSEPWYVNVMAGIQRELREHGYYVCAVSGEDDVGQVRESLEFFSQLRVAAAVIGPLGAYHEYEELRDAIAQLRFVAAFDTIDELPLASAEMNIYQAAVNAVAFLHRNGHRRIGYICQRAPGQRTGRRDRISGFLAEMERLGLEVRPEWFVDSHSDVAGYETELRRVHALPQRPTAFFCLSDHNAMMVLKACHRIGWRIPDEVSLISVDNLPEAELTIPGLTSMGFDCAAYARSIARLVLDGIAGKTGAERARARLEPQLIVRESVRPPAACPLKAQQPVRETACG